MATSHRLPASAVHHVWDRSIPPSLTINSGDTVVFKTPEITDGQITPGAPAEILNGLDFGVIHQISGPVAVAGAEPGDSLIVEILDIVPAAWGWSAVIPGFNALAEDAAFATPFLHHWDLTNGKSATFKPGIVIPFEPFCGLMGVAPSEEGSMSTIPPRRNGGNLDIRQLVKGTTVHFPVLAPGANFSVGDVHATQGDGEVCGTGIECQATVTLKFTLRKNREIPELHFHMPGAMTGSWNTKGWIGFTAHGPEMFGCAQQSLRYMIDYLKKERGLTDHEAFVLCSACVDLKISEMVDQPNWIVSALLPLGIFV